MEVEQKYKIIKPLSPPPTIDERLKELQKLYTGNNCPVTPMELVDAIFAKVKERN